VMVNIMGGKEGVFPFTGKKIFKQMKIVLLRDFNCLNKIHKRKIKKQKTMPFAFEQA